MWRWRCLVLRMFGARIGTPCDVRGSAQVWFPPNLELSDRSMLAAGVNCYNVALVRLGSGSIVSQGAYLCTASHDVHKPDFPLLARPITIAADCWIASEAFVGPGVTIDEGAVLAARAVAMRDLDAWTIYVGNPAKPVRKRSHNALDLAACPTRKTVGVLGARLEDYIGSQRP